MNDLMTPEVSWADVVKALWPPDSRKRVTIPKNRIAHPTALEGVQRSFGLPEGQSADYRLRLAPTTAGLHVREYGYYYEAHLDAVDPSVDVIEHMRRDAPGAFIGGAAAVGAIVGASLGRSGGSAAAGALVGVLLAALLDSASPKPKPVPGPDW